MADFSRRDFLKGAGTVLGATAITTSIAAMTGCSSGGETPGSTDGGSAAATTDFDLYETDVLVIGTGCSGVYAALEAYTSNVRVLMVDKGPFGSSGTAGSNLDLAQLYYTEKTPANCHLAPYNGSSLSWADELINQKVSLKGEEFQTAKLESWNIPMIATRLGNTSLTRNPDGTLHDLFEGEGAALSMYGFDGYFLRHMLDYVASLDLPVVDNTMITELFISDGVCTGAIGFHVPTGRYRVFRSKSTVICTNGCAQVYGHFRMSARGGAMPDNTGDVDAAAFRHGCQLINSEFLLTDLANTIPETFAGSTAVGLGADSSMQKMVCDKNGDFFLAEAESAGYLPLGRRVIDKVLEGKGGEHGGVFLDLTDPDMPHLTRKVYQRDIPFWKEVFGIDVLEPGMKVPLAIQCLDTNAKTVVDEYMMTEIPGLFSARGVGNMTTIYTSHIFGAYAGNQAASYAQSYQAQELDWSCVEAEITRIEGLLSREGTLRQNTVRESIQDAVYAAISLGCDAEGLNKAIAELERIKSEDLPKMYVSDKSRCCNFDLKHAIETYNILDIAEAIIHSSLVREESRGFFYRTDFPDTDNDNWLVNTLCRLTDGKVEVTTRPVVTA
jgi:succinate dehydrogenase / fumarate reductase flavoprotein subunit